MIFFSFLSYKNSVRAQGTFECVILHSGMCMEKSDGNKCNTGYEPGDCSIWRDDPKSCPTPHTCVTKSQASSCTTKLNLIPCSSDYPIECAGKYQCCREQSNCDAITSINYRCDPGTGNGNDGVITALGCIPTSSLNGFLSWILPKVIGIASGIAFLLMAFGAFQIITSSGDPKKTQAGKELITSALSGLLFIILSIFLLKLIGVDILQIPGFAEPEISM